jgi:protein-tyrosine phosphatase
MADPKRVLFICTGNYYRSRFAEALFNHLAEEIRLPWRAFSRGLAIHWAEGPISEHTRRGLAERRIDLRHTGPERVQLAETDLRAADLIIALKDQEHRPMIAEQFPDWSAKVVFWDVTDLPYSTPEVALPAIEELVGALVADLETQEESKGAEASGANA